MNAPGRPSSSGDIAAPDGTERRRRIGQVIGVATSAACLLVAGAVVVGHRDSPPPAETVLAAAPRPVPAVPFSDPPPTAAPAASPTPTAATPPALAASTLLLPSLGLEVPVVASGIVSRQTPAGRVDDVDVPDVTHVGLYRYASPVVAAAGTTVVVGHVTWNSATGPFFRLSTIRPGAVVWLSDDSGRVTGWRVDALQTAPTDGSTWPTDIYATTGPRRLVLVTCSGDLVPTGDGHVAYTENLFVYATPLATGDRPTGDSEARVTADSPSARVRTAPGTALQW